MRIDIVRKCRRKVCHVAFATLQGGSGLRCAVALQTAAILAVSAPKRAVRSEPAVSRAGGIVALGLLVGRPIGRTAQQAALVTIEKAGRLGTVARHRAGRYVRQFRAGGCPRRLRSLHISCRRIRLLRPLRRCRLSDVRPSFRSSCRVHRIRRVHDRTRVRGLLRFRFLSRIRSPPEFHGFIRFRCIRPVCGRTRKHDFLRSSRLLRIRRLLRVHGLRLFHSLRRS
mgnify:CR=1 FL=1